MVIVLSTLSLRKCSEVYRVYFHSNLSPTAEFKFLTTWVATFKVLCPNVNTLFSVNQQK